MLAASVDDEQVSLQLFAFFFYSLHLFNRCLKGTSLTLVLFAGRDGVGPSQVAIQDDLSTTQSQFSTAGQY